MLPDSNQGQINDHEILYPFIDRIACSEFPLSGGLLSMPSRLPGLEMSGAKENSRYGHVFRPGPFHKSRAYWLDGAILHWRIGDHADHVALDDIAAMRLYLPAGGEAVTAQCVIVENNGRRHRISDRYWWRWTREERHRFGRHQRRTDTFRGLVCTLARRLVKANPQAVCQTGPGRGIWIASCLVASFALVIVLAGAGLMLKRGEFSLVAAAFTGVAILYLPLLWPVIRSGGPKPLDPETL